MNDPKNITIALLCCTATLLTAAMFFLGQTDTVVAAGAESRGGDFIMAVAKTSSAEDIVCVIDTTADLLNAYSAGKTNPEIVLRASIDLGRAFESIEENQPIQRRR